MANDTPASTDRTATPTYRVTFDRIGRNHNVEPLDLLGADKLRPDQLADSFAAAIHRYALTHLGSRDVEVHVDLTEDLARGDGVILCGFRPGGAFTVERTGDREVRTDAAS